MLFECVPAKRLILDYRPTSNAPLFLFIQYLNSPFKPFTGRQASPHALEWVDLGLRALEKRVTTAWDRADDLFADAPPRAAVIFLHGNGDSGAGAQVSYATTFNITSE